MIEQVLNTVGAITEPIRNIVMDVAKENGVYVLLAGSVGAAYYLGKKQTLPKWAVTAVVATGIFLLLYKV